MFTRNTYPKDLIIESAAGTILTDNRGNKILDFCAQTLNASLGHCNPVVNEALSNAMREFTFLSSRFGNRYTAQLISELAQAAPFPDARINLKMVSGSEANEAALKAAYKRRGSKRVISMLGSHHGQTMETMRVSGKHFNREYLERDEVHFLQPCNCGALDLPTCDCAAQIEDVLSRFGEQVAALIIEPVMVDAGVLIPSKGFLQTARRLTEEHGVSLIFDEVQTGMGWTGEVFAADLVGISPDVLTLAKGLAAGLPLAAAVMRPELDVLDYGEHEITPGGNPLFCAVALANLNLLKTTDLLDRVRSNGARLKDGLDQLMADRPDWISAVRGLGLIYGLEIAGDRDGSGTSGVYQRCLDLGLLLRSSKVGERADVLQLKPPLTVTADEIDTTLDILRTALSADRS